MGWLTMGGTAPPTVSQFLEIVKDSSANLPLTCKQTKSEPTLQPTLASGFLTPNRYCPVLITPGPGTRQLESTFTSQSLLKLFKLANPSPAFLDWLIPSYGNHNKSTGPYFSLFPLPPDCLCVAAPRVACRPPLEMVNIILFLMGIIFWSVGLAVP